MVGGEHTNTSEMKSTWSQLHKTSNIIAKNPLEHEVMLIWKKFHFFLTEIFGFCVDLRSDNDMYMYILY